MSTSDQPQPGQQQSQPQQQEITKELNETLSVTDSTSGEEQPKASQQSTTTGQPLSLDEIQQRGLCNWCRNQLVITDNFSESNFVDIGRTWHEGDTDNAQAVYCGDCLNDQYKKDNPKAVVDRTNLSTCNIEELPDLSQGT